MISARALVSIGIWISTCAGSAAPAGAQDSVAAFYRGKQLRMIVGTGAGGGYDLFARAVARHIGEHIPGNPTVIVQNQPAASGLVMVNQLYSIGPRDGTVIAAPVNGIPTAMPPSSTGSAAPTAKPMWPTPGTRLPCAASPT